ncbi:MAG: M28 family peptidase [Planctomycetota bacterium]
MSRRLPLLLTVLLAVGLGAWWLYGGTAESVPPLAEAESSAPSPRSATPSEAPIDAARLRELMAALPAPRSPGSVGHAAAREFLLARLNDLGWAAESQPFVWEGAPDVALANVVARRPAFTPDAPLLLLGTHYDTVPGTPGADDNGSGTVVLLELARRLRTAQVSAEIRLLWFDAEETGLLGSGAYVRTLPPEEARRVIGLVQLEMLGFVDRTSGSQRLPPGVQSFFDPGDRGDFLLVLGNLLSSALALTVSEALEAEHGEHFRSEVFAWIPGEGWVLPDSRRSDHAMFWDAGLPAVLITDTADLRNPHYHRGSDRADTLDFEFMAAGARGLERAARRLAGED